MKTVDKETIRAVAEVEKAVAIVKESLFDGDFSRSVDELERRVHKLRCPGERRASEATRKGKVASLPPIQKNSFV